MLRRTALPLLLVTLAAAASCQEGSTDPGIDAGLDAGVADAAATDAAVSDAGPDATIDWTTFSCNNAGPGGTRMFCSEILICTDDCLGDETCMQACLDSADNRPGCDDALAMGGCIAEQTAPDGPCPQCAGFMSCLCGGDCSAGQIVPGCVDCVEPACFGIFDCLAGGCL